MTTLYHPDLPKGQNECEVPDDAEGTISVLKKSGWQKTKPSADKGKTSDQGGK